MQYALSTLSDVNGGEADRRAQAVYAIHRKLSENVARGQSLLPKGAVMKTTQRKPQVTQNKLSILEAIRSDTSRPAPGKPIAFNYSFKEQQYSNKDTPVKRHCVGMRDLYASSTKVGKVALDVFKED